MKTLRCLFTLSLVAVSAPSFSHTNGLDASFGTGGAVSIGPTPVTAQSLDSIFSIAVQNDGKLMVGGMSTLTSGDNAGSRVIAVGRLNADGSWDTTFADHGLFQLPYGTASAPLGGKIDNIALLSDGGILAEGGALLLSGSKTYSTCTVLFKLDSTGALDGTFGSGHTGSFCFDFGPPSSRNGHYSGLQIGTDDSFYITAPTTLDHGAVAHFDAEGVLISSYGVGGVAALPTSVYASLLNLQSDGLLLVPGIKLFSSTIDDEIAVVRLKADGTIDTGYGNQGVFATDRQTNEVTSPESAAIDRDGRLLIADNDFDGLDYLSYRFFRATDSGVADDSFNSAAQQPGSPGFAEPVVSGSAEIDQVVSILALPDGHIIAAGDAQDAASENGTSNVAILRMNEDSGYDASFGDAAHPGWTSINIGPPDTQNFVKAMAADSKGHAFIAATLGDGVSQPCPVIVRIVPDRLFDDIFESPPPTLSCPQ